MVYSRDWKDWPNNDMGYKFVQAYEGNTLYNYSHYHKKIERSIFDEVRDIVVKKSPAKSKARYMVTYEHHMNTEDRLMGIASNTVKVIDTQTGEVLGEYVRYVEARNGFSANRHGPAWASQNICGAPYISGPAPDATKHFVQRVLIPKK